MTDQDHDCNHPEPGRVRIWIVQALSWVIHHVMPGWEVTVLSPCAVEKLMQRQVEALAREAKRFAGHHSEYL